MFILDVSQIKENFLKNSISTETHNQIYFGCTKQQIKNQTKKKTAQMFTKCTMSSKCTCNGRLSGKK